MAEPRGGTIGFVTAYQRRESCYAAVAAAEFLRSTHEVAIITGTSTPARIHHDLDRLVTASHAVRFPDWVEFHAPSTLVWTEACNRAQVEWAKSLGIHTVLISSACEDDGVLAANYPAFDKVAVTSDRAYEVLDDRGHSNLVACPWSPHKVVVRKPPAVASSPPLVYIPAESHAQQGLVTTALAVAGAVLRHGVCSVEVTHAGWRPDEDRYRRALADRYGPRFVASPPPDHDARLLKMSDSDVVCAVSRYEPTAFTTACALHSGTPVVAFGVPPVDELVVPGVNGYSVRDTPDASRDYSELASMAVAAATTPALPMDAGRVEARRERWERVWLGLAGVND